MELVLILTLQMVWQLITDVGDGWYRCVATATDMYFYWILSDNGGLSVTANGTDGLFIWGAMINKGTSVKPYIKTTDRLDIPRLDYSGGSTNPTLLLEPQRTNLVDNGSTISNWTLQGVTRLLNQGTSPQNIQEATLISETNDNSNHLAFVPFYGLSSGSQYTYSGFVKQGTQRYAFFHLVLGSVRYGIIFDFVTKSVTDVEYIGTPINESYYFTEYNDGWFRLVISMQKIGSGTAYPVIGLSDSPTPTYNNFAQPIYQGNSSKNIYVWGFQLEQGSYSTSYIPTSGTSVTRVGDVCDDGGDATTFNDTEGVLFVEIAVFTSVGNKIITLSDGGNNNRIYIGYNTNNRLDVNVTSGGSYQVIFNYTGVTNPNSFNKIAFKYKENDFALWINGVEVLTDTSGITPNGLDELNLCSTNTTADFFYGKCKQVIYFNEALTDTELEELTTI